MTQKEKEAIYKAIKVALIGSWAEQVGEGTWIGETPDKNLTLLELKNALFPLPKPPKGRKKSKK